MTFDDANICIDLFAKLLTRLMKLSNEASVYFIVLPPDPLDYYYRISRNYPTIEIVKDDLPDGYIEAVNKEFPNNGKISHMCSECVIAHRLRGLFVIFMIQCLHPSLIFLLVEAIITYISIINFLTEHVDGIRLV